MWSQGTYCGYCTGGTDFHFLADNERLGVGWGCLYKKKVNGGEIFTVLIRVTKTLNNFLPNYTPPPTQLQTMTLGATVCQNAVILLAFDVHFSVSVFRIFIVFSYSTCSFALQNELANLRVRDQPLFQTGSFIFDQKVF